jgi:hypothetical protein
MNPSSNSRFAGKKWALAGARAASVRQRKDARDVAESNPYGNEMLKKHERCGRKGSRFFREVETCEKEKAAYASK